VQASKPRRARKLQPMSETIAREKSDLPVLPPIPGDQPIIQAPTMTSPESPRVNPAEIERQARKTVAALKRFVRKIPEVIYVDAGSGNKHPRIEAWQFVAACNGHSAIVSSTEEVISDKGEELGFIAVAHELNAAGRVVSGAEAACMRSETDWAVAPSYQLRSMAQTRACGKAHRNIFAYIMVWAGFCGTPAEEMPGAVSSHEIGERFGTPCYQCGNGVSIQRAAKTKKKYGFSCCVPCEKKELTVRGEQIMQPINDAKFVQQSVDQVKARKAAQGQPIVALAEAMPEEAYGD
jgi:hypothetical protein